MLVYEDLRPSDQLKSSWKMKWQDLHGSRPTQQQILLDDLAANFMLSGFGRPGALFEGANPWLQRDRFTGLESSRENHLYLQSIACKLLDSGDPHILEVGQIIELISDLEILAKVQGNHPYRKEFEGVNKFYHSDFVPLRKSLRTYWGNFSTDRGGLKKQVEKAIAERYTRLKGGMVKAQDVVDRMAHIFRLDYRNY